LQNAIVTNYEKKQTYVILYILPMVRFVFLSEIGGMHRVK